MKVRQTEHYADWFGGLKDLHARVRILARIRRLQEFNHAGDCKAVGDGIQEMRIDCGPGYRVYFVYRSEALVILLSGGSKKRQTDDIAEAKRLAKEL